MSRSAASVGDPSWSRFGTAARFPVEPRWATSSAGRRMTSSLVAGRLSTNGRTLTDETGVLAALDASPSGFVLRTRAIVRTGNT